MKWKAALRRIRSSVSRFSKRRRGRQRSNFVILCRPRTGSYHLTSLLDSCPDIICHGELFKPARVELRSSHKQRIRIRRSARRDRQPMAFIRQVRDLDPDLHFGFKLFTTHVSRVPELEKLLASRNWKLIILQRDPIETYASSLRAKRTHIWTLKEGRSVNSDDLNTPVRFKRASLKKFAGEYNASVDLAARLCAEKREVFVIDYSQLHDPSALNALLRFIGSRSDPHEMTSKYQKQYSGTVEDGFSNWRALDAFVQGKRPFKATLPTTNTPAADKQNEGSSDLSRRV